MTSISKSNSGRIEAIDVLRGFTLLGIIIVHMVEQYYAGAWPEEFAQATTLTVADKITSGFVGIFIIGKFYMIFSFLFGLSFFIQFSKSDSEKNFLARFTWRLVILFIIGFIHQLHYRGDILTIYAILGLSLLIFYRLPDKFLVVLSLFLIFDIPAVITRGVNAIYFPTDVNPFGAWDNQTILNYFNTLKVGPYFEILRANFYELATKMNFQVISGRLYITLGLFLLGIYAGRKNLFEKLEENIPLFKKGMMYALFTIVGLIVSGVVVFGVLKFKLPESLQWMIGGFVMDLFNAALAFTYVAGILILFQKEKWQKRLMNFYPVGRMGLTTYLMQTLFGVFIFHSYGLGLLADIGAFYSFLIAIALFVVQIIFAKYWFARFNFGPVEWIWRNLTYLKIHPMSLSKTESVTNQ
jgi:uncharacterized protein